MAFLIYQRRLLITWPVETGSLTPQSHELSNQFYSSCWQLFLKIYYNIVLPSTRRYSQRCFLPLFLKFESNRTPYTFHILSFYMFLDLIILSILVIIVPDYEAFSILYSHPFWDKIICLGILFSNILSLSSTVNVRD